MSLTEIVKRAQALADEEEQLELHRRYKRELLAIVGIPFTGAPQAIPQTLTAMQVAELVIPDCEKTQKIIAHCIIVKYGHRAIWNDDHVSDFLNELAIELKITLPDIAHWWLNGARPCYAICSQPKIVENSSNQAAIEPANTKHIENMDKSITVTVQQEREKVLTMLLDELNAKNNGQLNLQALTYSKEDMRLILIDKSSLFDGLSNSQFNKFWTAQKLCKLMRGIKPRS